MTSDETFDSDDIVARAVLRRVAEAISTTASLRPAVKMVLRVSQRIMSSANRWPMEERRLVKGDEVR